MQLSVPHFPAKAALSQRSFVELCFLQASKCNAGLFAQGGQTGWCLIHILTELREIVFSLQINPRKLNHLCAFWRGSHTAYVDPIRIY